MQDSALGKIFYLNTVIDSISFKDTFNHPDKYPTPQDTHTTPMFHKYNSLLQKYPYKTNMATTGILFTFGDAIAQHFFPPHDESDKPVPYDYHRSLRAWCYGSIFFSPLSVFWYGKTLPRLQNPFLSVTSRSNMTEGRQKFWDVTYRLLIDQLFVPGLIWIPYYNVVQSTLALHEHPLDVAYEKLQKNWWNVLTTNWTVWPFFQIASLTYIPPHLRVVSANVVSIGWNCFLSSIHNSGHHYKSKILENIHELDETAVNISS